VISYPVATLIYIECRFVASAFGQRSLSSGNGELECPFTSAMDEDRKMRNFQSIIRETPGSSSRFILWMALPLVNE
jgi:hypothetical protein